MKKIIVAFFVVLVTSLNVFASVDIGVEQPVVKQYTLSEPQKPEAYDCSDVKEIKDSVKVNSYDNVPIFNKNSDKKINIILKQPSAVLGTQQ